MDLGNAAYAPVRNFEIIKLLNNFIIVIATMIVMDVFTHCFTDE